MTRVGGMFPTVRQTRRQVHPIDGRRRTAKVQRGGAAWANINNKDIWKTILAGKSIDIPLTLDNKKTSDDPEEIVRAMGEWLECIEKQDEIFEALLNYFTQMLLKIPKGTHWTSIDITRNISTINKPSARNLMVSYINDVEQMVNFNIVKSSSQDKLDYTKLEDIKNQPSESLASLLIFPKRLSNIFINSLANLFITLNLDDTILSQVIVSGTQLDRDSVTLIAEQFESNIRGNAFLQTARALRDGFYLGQTKGEFGDVMYNDGSTTTFFQQLIYYLHKYKTSPKEFIFNEDAVDGSMTTVKDYSYGLLAAHIFFVYKHYGKDKNILDFFSKKLGNTSLGPVERSYTPESKYDNVPVRGVTTLDILQSWMYIEQLQFMLHLFYTIGKNEDAVVDELAENQVYESSQQHNTNPQKRGSGTP